MSSFQSFGQHIFDSESQSSAHKAEPRAQVHCSRTGTMAVRVTRQCLPGPLPNLLKYHRICQVHTYTIRITYMYRAASSITPSTLTSQVLERPCAGSPTNECKTFKNTSLSMVKVPPDLPLSYHTKYIYQVSYRFSNVDDARKSTQSVGLTP